MKITKILRLKRPLYKHSRYNVVTKIASSTVYLGSNWGREVGVSAGKKAHGTNEKVATKLVYFLNPIASLTLTSPVRLLRQPRLAVAWPAMHKSCPPLNLWPSWQASRARVPARSGRTAKHFLVHTKDDSVQTEKLFFVNSFKISYCLWATASFSKLWYLNRESKCI